MQNTSEILYLSVFFDLKCINSKEDRILSVMSFECSTGLFAVLCKNSHNQSIEHDWENLTKYWHQGNKLSSRESLEKHYSDHVDQLGDPKSYTIEQYVKDAVEMRNWALSSKAIGQPVDGFTEGVLRYRHDIYYVDLAPNGKIISYGTK